MCSPDANDDRGLGHADEAMEVNEREPKEAESKAARIRKTMKDLSKKSGNRKLRAVSVAT